MTFRPRATAVGQTTHNFQPARLKPADDAILREELAVNAVDGEVREVTEVTSMAARMRSVWCS